MCAYSRDRVARALRAAATSVALVVPVQAEAREQARLAYGRESGAETCPSEEELGRAVVARLGYDPFDQAPETAPTLHVRFAREPSGGYRATVERRTASVLEGSRTVRSARCAELVAPTAIAISIALDPLASSTNGVEPLPAPEPAPRGVSRAESVVAGRADVAPPPVTSTTSATWHVLVDLSPHVAFGSQPAPAAGLRIGIGGLRRSGVSAISLAVEGRVDLPSSKAGPTGGEVSAELVAASVVPCVRRSMLAGCVVLSAGSVLGEGRGVTRPSRDASLYVAGGARLAIEHAVEDWLALGVRGELVAAPLRNTMRLDGIDVWTSPVLNASIGVGATAIF